MPPQNFKSLYLKEQSLLNSPPDPDEVSASAPGPAEEPCIKHTPAECVGLALSGGGIRSATFNLGLMQGLHNLKALQHVHYLATVSGGGYIGAWWSAWLNRTGGGAVFPESSDTRDSDVVRHLREFSNFVAPRLGFFQSETWNCVVAFLSALLPALATALSVLALVLFLWVGLNWVGFHGQELWVALGLALLVEAVFEAVWRQQRKSEDPRRDARWFALAAALALLCVVLAWLAWPWLLVKCAGSVCGVYGPVAGWHPLVAPPGEVWWQWIGIVSPSQQWLLNPQLFAPAVIWLTATLPLMLLRMVIVRGSRRGRPVGESQPTDRPMVKALDRATQRLLGLAVIWAVVGLLWWLGCCWDQFTAWLAGGAAAGGGLFALLSRWIGEKLLTKKKGAWLEKLKPLLPQTIAYVTLALAVVWVASLMAHWLDTEVFRWKAGLLGAGGIVVLALLLFNPTEVGLHALYRSRIARAYLGASNLDAQVVPGATRPQFCVVNNRQTDLRDRDDLRLSELAATRQRPLHLVCCAANDVGGDRLATLARGSRSAVLSGLGFAMGNYWEPETGLSLGSAVTASAAAFNSNMGSMSIRLGSAVTFLMTALNLRLGLWVPNPLADRSWWRFLPGRFFFKELTGRTRAGFRPGPDGALELVGGHVHLSDGAHFENLALYELVRRHCRYIIVSDCGADPTVAFDDFGNAVRRIREDFGVEIEIDLDPLRPGPDHLARQHMAVGTIHYDSNAGLDKGILLYFKPTLTGDEPGDVTQYKTRNPVFPHETTGDQFYDEAQWESYRRLGVHAAHAALRFLEKHPQGLGSVQAHTVFTEAHWEWYSAPPDIGQNFTDLTSRCVALEGELRNAKLPVLTRQVFPELDVIAPPASPAPTTPEDMEASLRFVLQATQLMEDVWFVAHLDTHWNHPINLGWMNYFQRWTSAPLFRLWWPLLSPQFNLRFRRFMERECKLPASFGLIGKNNLRCGSRDGDYTQGLAWRASQRIHPLALQPGTEIYWLEVKLKDETPGQPPVHSLQLAVAAVCIEGHVARWHGDDVFILPGLWNSGFGTPFVRLVLDALAASGVTEGCVTIGAAQRTDDGSRRERADHIEFYRRLQFSRKEDRLVRKLARTP